MDYQNHIPSQTVEMEGSSIHCQKHGRVCSKRFMMPKPGPQRVPENAHAIAYYECERCFQENRGDRLTGLAGIVAGLEESRNA
jgi:hypothetical protein